MVTYLDFVLPVIYNNGETAESKDIFVVVDKWTFSALHDDLRRVYKYISRNQTIPFPPFIIVYRPVAN